MAGSSSKNVIDFRFLLVQEFHQSLEKQRQFFADLLMLINMIQGAYHLMSQQLVSDQISRHILGLS